MSTIHVVGAGLSGLSCAVRAAMAGRHVVLYEAAGHAGGRCRSFVDESLGCLIDNGNHLLMGACESTLAYMADIDARNMIADVSPASYPFIDLSSGERWRIRPSSRFIPTWLFSANRRVPGTRPSDYLAALRLSRALPEDTIADCVGTDGVLYERLWQPLSRAVLNTDAAEGSARLLWRIVRETFMKGEAASRPLYFHKGLSGALIDPAVKTLGGFGAEIRMKARLRGVGWHENKANLLLTPSGGGRRRGGSGGAPGGLRRALARRQDAPGIARHRECAFSPRRGDRTALGITLPWRDRRGDAMAVRARQRAVRDHQRRRPAGGATVVGTGQHAMG